MSGCRGGELHQHIINSVAHIASRHWDDFHVIIDDWTMMQYLKTKKRPDFILIDKNNTARFLIGEVGWFNPDKWPTCYPVIHLGKGGRISLINAGQEWETVKNEFYSLLSVNTEIGVKTNLSVLKNKFSDHRVGRALNLLLQGKRLNEIADMGILPNNDRSNKSDKPGLTREGIKHILSLAFGGGIA